MTGTAARDVSHALLVDLYELTMADVYMRKGLADRAATFSLFIRDLPKERGYLVAAGLDDALRWLEDLHFGEQDLAAIDQLGRFDHSFLDWLGGLCFTGDVRAVPEGTIVFAQEPILEVDAPLAQAQIAETYLLNQITLQTILATKASRLRQAARGRSVVDFGFRRAQGIDAGMKLARACRLVGLAGTSNVAAARKYDFPASGTMAHSFVQAFVDEIDAFVTFGYHTGASTVLLVDTYDTTRGVEHAIVAAQQLRARGVEITGIRLDSGDIAVLARAARRALDDAGFPNAKILASGGLDEHIVSSLVDDRVPIDGFGVGSELAVSADAPTLDSVYKLVAIDGRPVHKTSTGKATWPGPKQVWRADDWSRDVITMFDEPPPLGSQSLLELMMKDGERTSAGQRDLTDGRAHFEDQWRALPDSYKHLTEPAHHSVAISERLRALRDALDTAISESA